MADSAEPTVGTANESTRVAWLEKALAEVPTGWSILDAGAGEQQFKRFCAHLKYTSQDFAAYAPAGEAAGLQMGKWDYGQLDIVSDIVNIPRPNGYFDAVMCTEVLEHIPEPVRAIAEFSRLLRPGGLLIVTAPFCSLTHFAPHHHATGLSRFFYEKVLPQFGFEIVEMTSNGNYFEYLAQEIRRISTVSRRYAEMAPSVEQKKAMRDVLGFLEHASAADGGSSELLCFGWHVRAVKR